MSFTPFASCSGAALAWFSLDDIVRLGEKESAKVESFFVHVELTRDPLDTRLPHDAPLNTCLPNMVSNTPSNGAPAPSKQKSKAYLSSVAIQSDAIKYRQKYKELKRKVHDIEQVRLIRAQTSAGK